MRRRIAVGMVVAVLIICITVLLTGAGKVSADTMSRTAHDSMAVIEDMTGTWYLSSDMELKELERTFPDIFAFGCELEILPDGRISWHAGAAGAAGTYVINGNQIIATVSEVMEYDEYRAVFTMDDEGMLRMKYKNYPLKWTR